MKILFLLLAISLNTFAHSGRTNSSGCHHDKQNGGYHCHKSEDFSSDRRPASIDEESSKEEVKNIQSESDEALSR